MATYDIEALKSDLPNAKELSQFVYDKTGISLDLVGKPKEEQYLAAKNALEGKKVPSEFVTTDNPYVQKSDLIPKDEIPPLPERSKDLPDTSNMIHQFGATNMPHPLDPQSDRKVQIMFRKYDNNVITYQVLGPMHYVEEGTRINKYGQEVPERYRLVDPRTTELVLRNPDGTFTERGRGLYTYLTGEKGASVWQMVDRDLTSASGKNIADPWA